MNTILPARHFVATATLKANRGIRFRGPPAFKGALRGAEVRLQTRVFSSSVVFRGQPEVRILEVGPRDGLQNIKQQVATPVKIDLINRLAATGVTSIEATSFVSPRWIPQLADGKEVFREVLPLTQQQNPVSLPVLVPNIRGLQSAAESKAKDIVVFVSASEGFSRKNTNCTVQEGLDKAREVTQKALEQGMAVRGVVSCIFACPYDGPTEPQQVLRVAKEFLNMGCYEVGLGDTLGVGTPADVEKLLRVLLSEIPADKLAGHYHDTYGQAVANVLKSYELGLKSFDSSVAGLGGCPYAKGAKGNLATEDIVYSLEKTGVKTGINLEKLVSVGEWISRHLGQPNGSRAGSALFAKSETRIAEDPGSHEQIKSPKTWNLIEDKGEYNVSKSGNAIKITLTRPKNGNALTNSMVEGLTQLYAQLSRDPSVFHIFLTAEGRFFCTGMDLSSSSSSSSDDPKVKEDYYSKVVNLFSAIDNSPQTTIAVVGGSCYGGGNGLAFVNDIRLVSTKTRFSLTEIKLGLSPAIISKYLIREWSVSFLREALLTGREVPASDLQRIGAIHGLAENTEALEQLMNDYAEKLTKCAPQMATTSKELVKLGWTDANGPTQEEKIRHTFEVMMAPGSEGAYGLEQFRAKVKGIDWGKFWATQKAKL